MDPLPFRTRRQGAGSSERNERGPLLGRQDPLQVARGADDRVVGLHLALFQLVHEVDEVVAKGLVALQELPELGRGLHPGRLVALRGGQELRHDPFRLLQTRRILDDRRERLLDPAGKDGGPGGGSEVALGPELLPLLDRNEGPHRQEGVHHRQRGLPAIVPEEADGELAFADGGGLVQKSRPHVRLGRLHDVEGRLPLRVVLPSGLHDLPGALGSFTTVATFCSQSAGRRPWAMAKDGLPIAKRDGRKTSFSCLEYTGGWGQVLIFPL
ncbi:MAG: hypothetical protein IPL90_19915 [Holophagales bacterium]|nr:hypothetical protein [Holophagales bacterium]